MHIRAVVICLLFVLAPCSSLALVDAVDFGNGGDVTGFTRSHAGWSSSAARGGSLAITPNGVLSSTIPFPTSEAYLKCSFPQPKNELWISFTMRIVSATNKSNWIRPLIVFNQQNKEEYEIRMRSNRMIELTSRTYGLMHATGHGWWPGETYRLTLGLKQGKNGFVRFYSGGAMVYEYYADSADVGRMASVGIGGFSTEATNLAGTMEFSDIRIGSSQADVMDESQVSISVGDRVVSKVNPDCFGINMSFHGQTEIYPAVYNLQRVMRFNAMRYGYRCADRNWDGDPSWVRNPKHGFYYKNQAPYADQSFLHAVFQSTGTNDPLIVCHLNHQGERESRWDAAKAVEWVEYNKAYQKPDGSVGLRAIYEVGNESSLPLSVTEGWYYNGSSYTHIGSGQALYDARIAKEVYPSQEGIPDCLSNEDKLLNYRLSFKPGHYLYLGFRWKFTELVYGLANLNEIDSNDEVRLDYEYWSETEGSWVNFNQWVKDWDKEKQPRLLYHSEWSKVTFDWQNLKGWGRRSIKDESGGSGSALSDDKLYYIRLSLHKQGKGYKVCPRESHVFLRMPPESYIEILKRFAPVRKAGGQLYAWAGSADFEQVEAANQNLFDGVVDHHYPGYGGEPDKVASGVHRQATSVLWSVELLRQRGLHLRKVFPGKKTSLTEWNCLGVSLVTDVNLLSGLRTAMAQCEILKGQWDSAMYHSGFCSGFLAYPFLTNSTTSPRLRPSGLGLLMTRNYSRDNILDARCSYAGLYVCAFRGDRADDVTLIVVNRTDSPVTASVKLPLTAGVLKTSYFTGNPADNNEESDMIKIKAGKELTVKGAFSYEFPAYSVTAFASKK